MPSYKVTQESLDRRFKPLVLLNTKNPSVRAVVKRVLINRDPTYQQENEALQTHAGRARSRQDLYLVLKHYFPETTYQDAAKIYNELKKEKLIDTWHCSTVNRIVCAPMNQTISVEQVGAAIDKAKVNLKARQRQKPTNNGTILQGRAKAEGSASETDDTDNRQEYGGRI